MQLHFEKVSQTLSYVFENAVEGDSQSVLKAFDEIGEKLWIMTIGTLKGGYIIDQLNKHNPKIGVELGTYIGYSAVKFGQHFKNRGDGHYYCVEFDPVMAAVATSVVKFAGLSDYVTVLHGDLTKNLPILKSKYNVESVDFFFIDHLKELYTQDFELADSNQLINKDTVIVADNILLPGAPEFVKYMESNPNYKFELQEATGEFGGKQFTDAILIAQKV